MPDNITPDKTTNWTDTQQVIAYSIVLAFISVIFIWMLFPPRDVDPAVLTVLNMLIGALIAKFGTIVDFNFGSSKGSKDKDEAQNKMVEKLTGTGNGMGSQQQAEAAAIAAAALAAPAAAAVAAPPAAELAAPPVVATQVPPAVETAVAKAMAAQAEVEKQNK